MNQFFLPKTGWELFDITRAYGLAIIVHTLSKEAVVNDVGSFYLIESRKKLNFAKLEEIYKFLGDESSWSNILLTVGGAQREKIKKNVFEFLTNPKKIKNILEKFRKLTSPPCMGKGTVTLYQPMDLAATKGIRTEILLKKAYSEGTPVKISMEDFSLSMLGHLNVTIQKFSKPPNRKTIFVIPTPTRTETLDIKQITTNLSQLVKGFHNAGWFPTLTQIAVNLVREDLSNKEGGKIKPRFKSLIYGVMTKTGNQWKPLTGGIFPLDFLYEVAQSKVAAKVLNKWKNIFEWTAHRKGYEELPTTLAEFIENPTLLNYERYIKIHLRNELDKKKIKFGGYGEELKEVLKYVRV